MPSCQLKSCLNGEDRGVVEVAARTKLGTSKGHISRSQPSNTFNFCTVTLKDAKKILNNFRALKWGE